MKFFALLLIASLSGADPVRIRLSRSVMLEGEALTITCLIEPSEDNETLTIALGGDGRFGTSSSRSLNGEMGGMFHTLEIPRGKIGCGIYTALCVLTRKINLKHSNVSDSARLVVKGSSCEGT